MFGDLFRLLTAFDQPFNQAPSLHIALLVILWALFARRLHGVGARRAPRVVRADRRIGADHLAASLHRPPDGRAARIFLSLAVAAGTAGAVRRRAVDARPATPRACRCGMRSGALAAAAVAIVNGGAALWALWVTVALALVALNYAWLGPAGFQKREGRLSPAAVGAPRAVPRGRLRQRLGMDARAFAVRSRRRRCLARANAVARRARARRIRRRGRPHL